MAVVGVVAVLAACSSSDDDGVAADGGGTEAPNGGSATGGGDITYSFVTETAGLDPVEAAVSPAVGGNSALAIYDSLMRVTSTDEVVPYLAESLESDDAQTWTLTLRPDVTFTDGTPLDAEAVVFNFERHMDPDLTAASTARAYSSLLSSVAAVDDLTVEIELVRPAANFALGLTEALGYIGSPTAIEALGEGFSAAPVGAGPYMFDEWIRDERLTLVRNPDYWQADAPLLDSITYRVIADADTRYNALVSGEIDLAYFQTPAHLLRAEDDDSISTDINLGNGGSLLQISVAAPPFDDIRVRRAIAHAVDFDALNATVFGGDAQVRRSLFSPDSPFFVEVDVPEYDPDEARRLIDEYESETGTNVTLEWLSTTSASGAQGVQASEVFQQLMNEIGIDTTITQYDPAEWFQHLLDGTFQVVASTYPHFTDPSEMAAQLSCDSPQNFKGYCNPEMDAALLRGAATTDQAERIEAYAEAQEILAEDLPQVWFASGRVGVLSSPSVVGVDISLNGTLYPATLGLSN